MAPSGGVAFVFPGQGSQYVGMGKELWEQFTAAREVFQEADDSLGIPLARLCFVGPETDLKLTENTQPAILTVSIAALRVLQRETPMRPSYVAGHSLGEYSALVCAGALAFADAVKIVRERGRLMQAAVPDGQGAMAVVIGMSPEAVQSLCQEAGQDEVLAPANFNGGGQIVIAGSKAAVVRATALAKSRGAKRVLDLPVSAPFHCPLMAPAAEGLREVLQDVIVQSFSPGVIANVDAQVNHDPLRVKPLLVEQAVKAVRWEESIHRLEELAVSKTLEVGPGKVLKGLVRRISSSMEADNFEGPQDLARIVGDGTKT